MGLVAQMIRVYARRGPALDMSSCLAPSPIDSNDGQKFAHSNSFSPSLLSVPPPRFALRAAIEWCWPTLTSNVCGVWTPSSSGKERPHPHSWVIFRFIALLIDRTLRCRYTLHRRLFKQLLRSFGLSHQAAPFSLCSFLDRHAWRARAHPERLRNSAWKSVS